MCISFSWISTCIIVLSSLLLYQRLQLFRCELTPSILSKMNKTGLFFFSFLKTCHPKLFSCGFFSTCTVVVTVFLRMSQHLPPTPTCGVCLPVGSILLSHRMIKNLNDMFNVQKINVKSRVIRQFLVRSSIFSHPHYLCLLIRQSFITHFLKFCV